MDGIGFRRSFCIHCLLSTKRAAWFRLNDEAMLLLIFIKNITANQKKSQNNKCTIYKIEKKYKGKKR